MKRLAFLASTVLLSLSTLAQIPNYKGTPSAAQTPGFKPDPGLYSDLLRGSDSSGSRIEACGAVCVPDLVNFLRSQDYKVQVHTAWLLTKLGPAAAGAVPALADALKNGEWLLRANAARALGGGHTVHLPSNWNQDFGFVLAFLGAFPTQGIHSNPGVTVPALVKALKDPNSDVRSAAAQALGAFSKSLTPEAKGALTEALTDKESIVVRVWAAWTLVRSGDGAALPSITTILNSGTSAPLPTGDDTPQSGRANAAFALGELGLAARPSLSALEAAAASSDERVAKAAKESLAKIGSVSGAKAK